MFSSSSFDTSIGQGIKNDSRGLGSFGVSWSAKPSLSSRKTIRSVYNIRSIEHGHRLHDHHQYCQQQQQRRPDCIHTGPHHTAPHPYRYNHWEQKGVPVRLEVGPRDLEKKQTVMARRDTGEKIDVPESDITSKVLELLETIQVYTITVSRCWVSGNEKRVSPPLSLDEAPKYSCFRFFCALRRQ